MTTQQVLDPQPTPESVSVDGVFDTKGNEYRGIAWRLPSGKYRCIAIVRQALCFVEVNLTFYKKDGS